jgi:hypothetical protein
VGSLALTRGGQIASSSIVLATGAGGNISVRADSITITGTSPSGASVLPIPFRDFLIDPRTGASDPASGLFSTASSANPDAVLAAGGSIDVTASSLTVRDGGKMSVATTGVAPGGSIAVRAPGGDVTLSGGGALFSSASGSARGGDINVIGDRVRLLAGGLVSADSTGTEDATAGSIDITFGRLFEMDGATMTTQSALADGGNISISSTGSVFRLLDSRITTSVQSGIGGGGNITIGSVGHPIDFVVLAGSEIRADAFGGPGGNIDIVASVFLSDSSLLSASSALSAPGVINIQADVTDVSGEVTQLPSDIVQAATLLRASCTARLAAGRTSSLVLAGREGVPPEPDGLLPTPLLPEISTILGSSPFEDDEQADGFPWRYRVSLDSRCAR